MTTPKITAKSKTAAKKTHKAAARNKPAPRSKAAAPARLRAAEIDRAGAIDHEAARGLQADPSDVARDQRLRNALEGDGQRSASDRHRERLTAVEAEEDGVRDDDDENDDEKGQRELALGQVEADEEEP